MNLDPKELSTETLQNLIKRGKEASDELKRRETLWDVSKLKPGLILFIGDNSDKVVLMQTSYGNELRKWHFAGLYNTLALYSTFGHGGASDEQLLEFLNTRKAKILGEIRFRTADKQEIYIEKAGLTDE